MIYVPAWYDCAHIVVALWQYQEAEVQAVPKQVRLREPALKVVGHFVALVLADHPQSLRMLEKLRRHPRTSRPCRPVGPW